MTDIRTIRDHEGKLRRIKTIHDDDDEGFFWGRYKGHDMFIQEWADGRYYIDVRDDDGSFGYDGWWSPPIGMASMDYAILEAIDGAQINRKKVES